MKICIISYYIPPDYSGAGAYAYKYSFFLYKKNLLHKLITVTLNNNQFIYTVNKNSFIQIIQLFIFFFKNRKLFETVHIFSASNKLSLFSIIISKIFNKNVVLDITSYSGDSPSSKKKSKLKYFFKYLQYKLSNYISCVSPLVYEDFIENKICQNKINLIPRSVFYIEKNVHDFSSLEKNQIRLLFIGSLVKEKGVDYLIPLYIEIKKYFDDVKLTIIGSHSIRYEAQYNSKKLKNEIHKLNLQDKIYLIEYTDRIEDIYKENDFLLFLSVREGMPNVVIEAMNNGLVVIGNEIEGITNYIIDDNIDGIIINIKNFDFSVNKIIKCIKNVEICKFISINAQRKIKNYFYVENIFLKYNNLYLKNRSTQNKIL